MFRVTRISTAYANGSHPVGTVFQTVSRQPNWIVRVAALTFLFILALPIVALAFFALFVSAVVFGTLILSRRLWAKIRGVLPNRDGRHNVRIITRDH